MAVADGAILRIVASMLFPDSVIAQNVFYAVFTDTGSSTDEQDVVDDLRDWVDDIMTEIENSISNMITPGTVKVYNYDAGDDDWDEVGESNMLWEPVSVVDMLPHGVAALIHAKSSDPDVQAAKFFGGLDEDKQADGTWSAPVLAVLALAAAEWVAPFVGATTGADFFPGVWSVVNSNFFYFNQTVVINSIPAYQRRRKPGVGI